MPLYMDIHIVPGVKAKDVAEAHRKDLLHQDEFGCNCMTYWIDEERETIFCLIDAENRDAVKEMHQKAHGLVPNKIIEVSSSIVQSFLGRIYDPEDAIVNDGLKVFSNPGFRVLLITSCSDHVLLRHRLGNEKWNQTISRFNSAIRSHLSQHEGSEVEHTGEGFIVSFESATKALNCAISIQQQIRDEDSQALNFRLALNGGEPIEHSNKLFGDTIDFGNRLCSIAGSKQIALAAKVKQLIPVEMQQNRHDRIFSLPGLDEDLFRKMYVTISNSYQDPEFDLPHFSQLLAISQTQLYRKATSLTGQSFNNLLKDYRLEKSKELMKQGRHSISQIAYDNGFSSPSYFTKCFKAKNGLLPMEYMDLLHLS